MKYFACAMITDCVGQQSFTSFTFDYDKSPLCYEDVVAFSNAAKLFLLKLQGKTDDDICSFTLISFTRLDSPAKPFDMRNFMP